VEATIEVGADPIGIASGEGSLWVVDAEINAKRGSVSRIDPTSGEVLATIRVGTVPLEVVVGEGSVWVSNSADDTVSRIDPSSDETVDAVDVCAAPEGLAVADGSVWVVCEDEGVVARIDPKTGEMGTRINVGLQPRFVTGCVRQRVGVELLRRHGHADRPGDGDRRREDRDRPGAPVHDRGRWTPVGVVHRQRHDQCDRPETNEVVANLGMPVAPDGLAFDGTTLWVATEIGPEIAGIDVRIQRIVASATVAEHGLIDANQLLVFEDGSLWLPILDDGTVLRVRPPAT
jgi:hypothetical protein